VLAPDTGPLHMSIRARPADDQPDRFTPIRRRTGPVSEISRSAHRRLRRAGRELSDQHGEPARPACRVSPCATCLDRIRAAGGTTYAANQSAFERPEIVGAIRGRDQSMTRRFGARGPITAEVVAVHALDDSRAVALNAVRRPALSIGSPVSMYRSISSSARRSERDADLLGRPRRVVRASARPRPS